LSPKSAASRILVTFGPGIVEAPQCFSIAFVDRSSRPETECWIFTSAETPNRCPGATCVACRANLLALLSAISRMDVPPSVHAAVPAQAASIYVAHQGNRDLLLVGSAHSITAEAMSALAIVHLGLPGLASPCTKYLFREPKLAAAARSVSLPEGLQWGQLARRDFALVRSRTVIPRQDATLASLESMAVFPLAGEPGARPDPIAWVFRGLDGSLTSLHVEEQWRGKKLAKLLAAKMLKGSLGEEGIAHADVAEENDASHGVCKSIGGESFSTVYWLRIDLAKVRWIDHQL
jgi:FR47-like protein